MKRLALGIVVCLLSLSGWAKTALSGYCSNGGVNVLMPSLGISTGKFLASYPGCTITVYVTGSGGTLATIYSDNVGTPKSNPFVADAMTGNFQFYADNGTYDVQESGGGLSGSVTLGTYTFSDPSAFITIGLNGNTLTAAAGSATITVPNVTDTLVNLASIQTLLNKTLTTPVLTTPTINGATLSGTLSGNATLSGNLTLSGANTISAKNMETIRFADQFGGFTDASIQAAINDAPDGGTVILPAGTYDLCNNLPITISKSIKFLGVGRGTVLKVCPSAGSTLDAVLIRPTNVVYQLEIAGMWITADLGSPGRYGLNFDGTNNSLYLPYIHDLAISNLGNCLIYGSGSGAGNGVIHHGTFARLQLTSNNATCGDIRFTSLGDSTVFDHIKTEGPGYGYNIDTAPGASTLTIKRGNDTSWSNIHLGSNIVSPIVEGMEIETVASSVGSNGAVIDLDGAVGSHVSGGLIQNNNIRIINGVTLNGIRVNYADSVNIVGNDLSRAGAPSKDIVITANATDTKVGTNLWRSGLPYSSMVSDSGSATVFTSPFGGLPEAINNNKCLGWFDDAGALRCVLQTASDGTVSLLGYHATPFIQSGNGVSYLRDQSGNNVIGVSGGIVSTYAGIGTVGNGLASIVAKFDATAQSANVGSTLVYAVPSTGAGTYLVQCVVVETTAATSSSTLPTCNISWTDKDTSTTPNVSFTGTSAANTVGTLGQGSAFTTGTIQAKASTNINISTASYASSGATAMQYAVHAKLIYLGN